MTLIISAAEVSAVLSISLNDADVQQAQDVIELFVNRDLATAGQADRFSAEDLRRLRLAVQWQTGYLNAHPEVLTDQEVESASANGASVKFKPSSDALLAPLAARFLQQLSWAGGPVKVQTLYPSREDYRPQPDPWVLLSTGGRL